MATLALFIAFFLRWSSLWVSLTRPPFPLGFERLLWLGMDELRRMAGDARRRVWRFAVAQKAGPPSPKVLSIS